MAEAVSAAIALAHTSSSVPRTSTLEQLIRLDGETKMRFIIIFTTLCIFLALYSVNKPSLFAVLSRAWCEPFVRKRF